MKENCWTIKIQVTDLHILDKVNLCVTLIHYTNYDVHPSNNLEDLKQNHETMKCSHADLFLLCGQNLGTLSHYLKI